MNLTVNQFVRTANSSWFDNAITLNKTGTLNSKFFHPKPEGNNKANIRTNQMAMRAFRDALENEFGATGAEAFGRVLNTRYVNGRSLRKSDVNAVMTELQEITQAAAHEKAHAERTVTAFAEETLTKLMDDKNLPYHTLSKDNQALLCKRAMKSFKSMVKDEAAMENILGEIKTPESVKIFEARMAILVKDTAQTLPSVNDHLKARQDDVKQEVAAQPKAKAEVKEEAQPEAEVKSAAVSQEAKNEVNLLRGKLHDLAEVAWASILKNPSYPYGNFSQTSQDVNKARAMKALEERLKDDDLVHKLQVSYEKDPKSLESVMVRLAIYSTMADLDKVLKLD